MRYSTEFKKSAVQKYLSRGTRSVNEIIQEIGISSPTIYLWRDELANVIGMKKPTAPQDRSAQEKFKSLTEYYALLTEERGEYLRRSGLHEDNINEWRMQIENALEPQKSTREERQALFVEQKKIKNLENEIRRKDKALAEVSALLILKKKADLLWGSEEDE